MVNMVHGLTVAIPAKTFILGEYAVLEGAGALMLMSEPYFQLQLQPMPRTFHAPTIPFHPKSPVAQLWQDDMVLLDGWKMVFIDPYRGLGGMGRSSAEFIGGWFAKHFLQFGEHDVRLSELLKAYQTVCKPAAGLTPSGVDVVSQIVQGGFVEVPKDRLSVKSVQWPFDDVEVVLLHTRQHCATAQHLMDITEVPKALSDLTFAGLKAFHAKQWDVFLMVLREFVMVQTSLGWLSDYSLALIAFFEKLEGVYAVKGCGAMGADVLAVFCTTAQRMSVMAQARAQGLLPLALGSMQKANGITQAAVVMGNDRKPYGLV